MIYNSAFLRPVRIMWKRKKRIFFVLGEPFAIVMAFVSFICLNSLGWYLLTHPEFSDHYIKNIAWSILLLLISIPVFFSYILHFPFVNIWMKDQKWYYKVYPRASLLGHFRRIGREWEYIDEYVPDDYHSRWRVTQNSNGDFIATNHSYRFGRSHARDKKIEAIDRNISYFVGDRIVFVFAIFAVIFFTPIISLGIMGNINRGLKNNYK